MLGAWYRSGNFGAKKSQDSPNWSDQIKSYLAHKRPHLPRTELGLSTSAAVGFNSYCQADFLVMWCKYVNFGVKTSLVSPNWSAKIDWRQLGDGAMRETEQERAVGAG